jgi:hypothetical protein
MMCAGCGQPLVADSGRGRPARYHDATCRQRARRARLATDHQATVDSLASAESAVSALQRAVLTNSDTTEQYRLLTDVIAELGHQLQHAPQSRVDVHPADEPVTKPVTINPPAPAAEQVVKTIDLSAAIGPDWTLTQRAGDVEASLWQLQHDGRPAGTVRRSYDLSSNTRGWEARTADYTLVSAFGALAASRRHDRLWRTRDGAAAAIAQHVATRKRPSRKGVSKGVR